MIEIKTVEEFDNIVKNNSIVIAKFGAEWCGPCKTMHTVLESLEQTLAEENIDCVTICESDVEETEDLANRYRIRNVPTTFIFKGGEIVEKLVGTHGEPELKQKIENIM